MALEARGIIHRCVAQAKGLPRMLNWNLLCGDLWKHILAMKREGRIYSCGEAVELATGALLGVPSKSVC